MQRQSPTYAHHQIRLSTAAGLVRSAIVLAAMSSGVTAGISQAAAQETEVGYITSVTGRVVALARGTPVLLNALDPVSDRTRLDLQANSELHICHYGTQRLYALKGPSRASVSAGGIAVESGKPLDVSKSPCVAPVVSNQQGGMLVRGIAANEEPGLRRNFFGK